TATGKCFTSIQTSASTAAPAFRSARWRPSTRRGPYRPKKKSGSPSTPNGLSRCPSSTPKRSHSRRLPSAPRHSASSPCKARHVSAHHGPLPYATSSTDIPVLNEILNPTAMHMAADPFVDVSLTRGYTPIERTRKPKSERLATRRGTDFDPTSRRAAAPLPARPARNSCRGSVIAQKPALGLAPYAPATGYRLRRYARLTVAPARSASRSVRSRRPIAWAPSAARILGGFTSALLG